MMGSNLHITANHNGLLIIFYLTSVYANVAQGVLKSDLDEFYLAPNSEFIAEKRNFYPFSSLYAGRTVQIRDDSYGEPKKPRGHVSTRSRSFIGKRSEDFPDFQMLEKSEKREYPNVFYRMANIQNTQGGNRLENHALRKRSPGDVFDDPLSADKRRSRSFIGKRNQESKLSTLLGKTARCQCKNRLSGSESSPEDMDYADVNKRRSFIGKRFHDVLSDYLNNNYDFSDAALENNENSQDRKQMDLEKRRSFIGKRNSERISSKGLKNMLNFQANSGTVLGGKRRSFIGKRRSFIGKRVASSVPLTGHNLINLDESGSPIHDAVQDIENDKRRSFIGKRNEINSDTKLSPEKSRLLSNGDENVDTEKRRSFIG